MASTDALAGRRDGSTPSSPGLDALELPLERAGRRRLALWAASWPKLMATAICFFAWQLVVWTGWKPEYLLPGPARSSRRCSTTSTP